MPLQFTPPAPIGPDEDPFGHIWRTKNYLDGLWYPRPDYVDIRFGHEVKYRLLSHSRMQTTTPTIDGPEQRSIWGIPIVPDETVPDGLYVITLEPPIGARS